MNFRICEQHFREIDLHGLQYMGKGVMFCIHNVLNPFSSETDTLLASHSNIILTFGLNLSMTCSMTINMLLDGQFFLTKSHQIKNFFYFHSQLFMN